MKNKRGWLRILEATVSVLIVAGVLIIAYSNQTSVSTTSEDYFDSLGKRILEDIAINSTLRLAVLNVDCEDDEEYNDDGNFIIVYNFVEESMMDYVGFSISICNMDDDTDFCKLNGDYVTETVDKNVYTSEMIISSELGDGDNAVYSPRKIRIFMWEN